MSTKCSSGDDFSPMFVQLRRTFVVGSLICILGWPAERADAAETAVQTDVGLQEIVVTASKRETNLQSTPISITALTGESLQEHGLSNLADVIHQTPGVSFKNNGGPGQTEIQVRGMNSAGGVSPTVGFYLDEVPLTPAAQSLNGKVVLDPNLFDLNRVEVLRGPQGTLYGSGSMGGTIRLITNQPDLKRFSVNAQAVASNTHGGGFSRAENGAINLPVIEDKVALRIVYSDSHDAGWIDRVVLNPFPLPTNPGPACGPIFYGCVRGDVLTAPVQARYRNVNDLQTTGARATVLIQPTERLSIEPMVVYQHQSSGGMSAYDTVPGTLAHYQPLDQSEPISDNFNLFSGTVKYHFDSFDLTSVSAKWDRRSQTSQDDNEIFQEFFFTPGFSTDSGGLGNAPSGSIDKVSQFSQELRISTNGQGPIKALLGAFYSDYDSLYVQDIEAPGAQPLFGQSTISFASQPTKIKQQAIFGEVSYKFAAPFEVTLGLRRYKYDSSLEILTYGIVLGNDINNPFRSFTKTSNVGYNPKFNLAYTPSDRDLLYVTVAKGFRPGSSNQPIPVTGAGSCAPALAALGKTSAPEGFGPDNVWSYEIGNKFQTDDRRLTLNTAVYYERWAGIQQLVQLSCGFFYTDNLGKANIYGGELELAARLTSHWTLTMNAAYTDAALAEDVPEAGAIKGKQLQNIPKFTGGAAIEYARPVNDKYKFITRLSGDYTSHRDDAYGPLPGYNLIDFRIGLAGDPWTVHLFAKNLTNQVVNITNTSSQAAQIPLYLRAASTHPAIFGLDVSYRF